MSKKKCPRCGTSVERTDKFCPKCGNNLQAVKSKTSSKIKVLWGGAAVILVAGIIIAVGIYRSQENKRVQEVADRITETDKSKDKQSYSSTSSSVESKKSSSKKLTPAALDTTDEMLMAYLSYSEDNYRKARGADSLSELIDTVQDDITSKRLTIKKLDNYGMFKVENKFGSVLVDVLNGGVNIYDTKQHALAKKDLYQKFDNNLSDIKVLMATLKKTGYHDFGDVINVDKLPEFTKLAVTAWLEPKSDDDIISSNIRNVLIHLNKGIDVAPYQYWLAKFEGLSDTAFGISLTHTGSDHLEIERYGDRVEVKEVQFGSKINSWTFQVSKLRQDYEENKAGIDEVIIGLDNNDKHLEEFQKKMLEDIDK